MNFLQEKHLLHRVDQADNFWNHPCLCGQHAGRMPKRGKTKVRNCISELVSILSFVFICFELLWRQWCWGVMKMEAVLSQVRVGSSGIVPFIFKLEKSCRHVHKTCFPHKMKYHLLSQWFITFYHNGLSPCVTVVITLYQNDLSFITMVYHRRQAPQKNFPEPRTAGRTCGHGESKERVWMCCGRS